MEESMPDGCQEVLRVEISHENDDLLTLHWFDATSQSTSSSPQQSLGLSRLVVIPHVSSLEQNILGSLYRCGESGNYILKLSIFGSFASKKLLTVCLCLFGNAYIVGTESDVIGIQEIATVLDSQIECFEITQQSYQTLITQDYQTLTEHATNRHIYCDKQQLEKIFEEALYSKQEKEEMEKDDQKDFEEVDHSKDKEDEIIVIQGIYGKVQTRICEQLLGFRREELKASVRSSPLTRSQLRAAKNKILAEQLSEIYKNGVEVNLKIVDRFDGWMSDVKSFNRLLTNTKCSQMILSEYRFLESKRNEYRNFEELIDDIELFYAFYIEKCPDYAGKKLIILEFLTKALKDAAREFLLKDPQIEDNNRTDKKKGQEQQEQQEINLNDSQVNECMINKTNDKNNTILLSSFNGIIDSTEQKEREAYYEGIMQQAHEQIEQFQRDIINNRQKYEQNISQLKEQSDKQIQELSDRIKELEQVHRKTQGNNRESTSKLEMDRLLLEQKVHFLEIELTEARKKAKGAFSFNQFLQENKHTQTVACKEEGEQIGLRSQVQQDRQFNKKDNEGQQLEEVRRELCFLSGIEMMKGEDGGEQNDGDDNDNGEEDNNDDDEEVEDNDNDDNKNNQDNSNKINILEMKLQEKDHHIGLYTAQLENTCRRLSELEQKEQLFDEQHSEWEHLQSTIQAQLNQILQQQQQISNQSSEVYSMEAQLNELYSQLNEQSRRYSELESELIETRDHNHQLSTHNSQYYHQIALYKQKALQAESLSVQLQEARSCQEKTERKLRESQQVFKSQVERIQEELMQRCTKEVQSKNAQILALTKHLAELDEQQQQQQQQYYSSNSTSGHNYHSSNNNNGRHTIGTGVATTIVDNHEEIIEINNNSGNSRSSRSSHNGGRNNNNNNNNIINTNGKEMSLSELVSVLPSKQMEQSSAKQGGLSTSQSQYIRSQNRVQMNRQDQESLLHTGGLSTKQSQIQQKELSFQQDEEEDEGQERQNYQEQQRISNHFIDQENKKQNQKNRHSNTINYSSKQQQSQEIFSNNNNPRDHHHNNHHNHNRSSSIQYSHTQGFYSQGIAAYPQQQYRSISESRDTNSHNDSSNNENSSRLDSKESVRIPNNNNNPYITKSPQKLSNSSSQQLHFHSLQPSQQSSLQYFKRESFMNSTPQGFLNNNNNSNSNNNNKEESPRLSNSQQLNNSNHINNYQEQLQLLRNKQSISSFNNEQYVTQDQQQQINQYQQQDEEQQCDFKQNTLVDSQCPDNIVSNINDSKRINNDDNNNVNNNDDHHNNGKQLNQGNKNTQEKQISTTITGVVGKQSSPPVVSIPDNNTNNNNQDNNHDSSYSTQQNQLSRVSSLSNVLDLIPMESSSSKITKVSNNCVNPNNSRTQQDNQQELQQHSQTINHERNTYNHSDTSSASHNINGSNLLLESFQPRTSERNTKNNIFKINDSHSKQAQEQNSDSSSSHGSRSSGSNYATTSYNIHGINRQTSTQTESDNDKEIKKVNNNNNNITQRNVTATNTLQKVNSMENIIKANQLEVIQKINQNEKIMNIWGNSNNSNNNNLSRDTLSSWLTSPSTQHQNLTTNLNSNNNHTNSHINIVSPSGMDTLGLHNSNQFNRQNLHSILHSIPSLTTPTTTIDNSNTNTINQNAYHSTLLLQAEKSPRISTRTITDQPISNTNNNSGQSTQFSYLNSAIHPLLSRVSSNKSPLHSNNNSNNATLSSYQERSSYSSSNFRLPTHNFSSSNSINNNIPNRFQPQITILTPQSRSVTPLHERKNTGYCTDKGLSPNHQQPSQFFTLNTHNNSNKLQTSIPKTFLKSTNKLDAVSKDHSSNNSSNSSISTFFKRL